nr:MAG TPA: hypothetical protein [Caudoviricetes sp.]
MTHEELIEHKSTLQCKINDISKTIDSFKSIGVTNLINRLEDTRDFLIQSVYIINTELYKEEETK